MIDLARLLRTLVGVFEDAGVAYAVVGSTAAAAWGVARTTRDIDIVVMVDADVLDAALETLVSAGLYVPVEHARAAARSGGSFNLLDPEGGGKIDLFVTPQDDAFTVARLERCIRADVFGVACWVASAEDVILAKLRWRMRSRPEVQWRDCVELAPSNDLDVDYMRRWAPELRVSEDLANLLDAVDES